MSSVQEIESAIRQLSPLERDQLVRDLPSILPGLNGDAAWDSLIHDARPRPALTQLLDEVDSEMKSDSKAFPEIRESHFDRQ